MDTYFERRPTPSFTAPTTSRLKADDHEEDRNNDGEIRSTPIWKVATCVQMKRRTERNGGQRFEERTPPQRDNARKKKKREEKENVGVNIEYNG
jgi:hypothetical protein